MDPLNQKDVAHNLNSSKRVIWGTARGLIKGDTRSSCHAHVGSHCKK